MTKRADGRFERKAMDYYPTPVEAVEPLFAHLAREGIKTFAEPCCGDGSLIGHLEAQGLSCVARGDLSDERSTDARGWSPEDFNDADAVITNPPWEHFTMAGIIEHQTTFKPGWFLIYSDWLFTKRAKPLLRDRCTDIVPVGRVKWIPDSPSVGFDNCCWVRMTIQKAEPTLVFRLADLK